MLLKFEQRLSPSPFVERVWRSRSYAAGSFHSMAEPNLELVVAKVAGRGRVILRGPVTRASTADCPADGEWLGIRFCIGAYLPGIATGSLRDHQSLILPDAGRGRFRLGDKAWEIPAYDTAECLIARLAAAGFIAREAVVDLALDGRRAELGLRSVQRRFLRATGLTREAFLQIERARYAAYLLRAGAPIGDVVEEAGYFDQPHLTRALRRLIGPTPRGLLQSDDQLSLLYKTTPPPARNLAWSP
ncbi:MAG: helix-turn-helix domain-containing protein [Caulobacteraceae bacterium]